VHALM